MSSRTIAISRRLAPAPPRGLGSILLLGAPFAALLAGMAAEWLDFRELRVPLLLMVGVGVLATTYVLAGERPTPRTFVIAAATGVATWAAAQCVYSLIHIARGEQFQADRFGPQWSQALGLIAAHGLFLGLPTGIAAGLVLQTARLRRMRAGA